jgi:hypothetical protein
MPPKYHLWTRETIAAVKAADRAYTRAWLRAMDALDRAPDLAGCKAGYNAIMGPAKATWDADIKAAIELSEDEF